MEDSVCECRAYVSVRGVEVTPEVSCVQNGWYSCVYVFPFVCFEPGAVLLVGGECVTFVRGKRGAYVCNVFMCLLKCFGKVFYSFWASTQQEDVVGEYSRGDAVNGDFIYPWQHDYGNKHHAEGATLGHSVGPSVRFS